MTVEVNRAVRLFGNLSTVGVFLHRAVIPCPPRRVGQVLNIVANGENHLIGDKPLVHQVQHKQVRHFPDNQLRLLRLIGTVQYLTGTEAVGAGTVCLDRFNGRRLPAPRMVDEQFRVLSEQLVKQVLVPLGTEGNIAHGEHSILFKFLGNAYSTYGAHVDDSTNFQVYNNTLTFDSTDTAVNETFGQLLEYNGDPIEAFYYSTSDGHGTDGSVWGAGASNTPYLRAVTINNKAKKLDLTSNEAFESFIKDENTDAYDSDFPMFRWNTKTTSTILDEKIGGVGRITGLTITSRGAGGYAKTLKVVGTEGSKTFSGQSRIRSILGNVSLVYNRKDGSTSTGWDTLPSGFIYIENNGTDENQVTTFTIYGGGFGHGVGMSQNGAQGMAKQGKTCQEILKFFYDGCGLMDISEVN